jgi:uncharacterized protein with HEPN domain
LSDIDILVEFMPEKHTFDYILKQISDADYESFVRNPTLKRAFVRSLEIIGEASKIYQTCKTPIFA